MSVPSCTITVDYFKAPNRGFAYLCRSHPPAWHVAVDGTICPSSRSRVIQLTLGNPANVFHGIRIATELATIKNSTDDYLNSPDTGIEVDPETFPSPTITLTDPMPGDQTPPMPLRVWYAVGIKLADGSVEWDDPRVYNPPDQ